ncbi:MAG: iron-containing alcohol dehydrogenase [Clostridia bacterium]|nr:iron-containing alcohol dehydrogenase [Clostridia bacterium]
MGQFSFNLPVKIHFGTGKASEIGKIVAKYGKTAMMVTRPWTGVQKAAFERVRALVEAEGVKVIVFDKVTPNPTTYAINEGTLIAKGENVDVLLGVGGGSSIDAAKAIAVAATHPGPAWDYVYTSSKTADPAITLPIIAVTTTSGTGSHVTKYSVFSNPDVKVKSTIVNEAVFPKESIVDPELCTTMPAFVTGTTGFDAFAHAFESYTNINANPFIDSIALQAIQLIVENLEKAVKDPENVEVREKMCYADTLAGISIANVGTTLPHSMGQPISGKCPWVSHGQSLTLVYPEFIRLTQASCQQKFAVVARMMDPALKDKSDAEAAAQLNGLIIDWQKRLGIYTSLEEMKVPMEEIEGLTADAMACPDTYVNPAVPTAEQVREMFMNMWSK